MTATEMHEPPSRKELSARIKENPAMTFLTTLVLLGAAVGAYANLSGFWAAEHTTASELESAFAKHAAAPHEVSQQQMAAMQREQKCATIDIQISIIEQQIWQMEQAGDTSARLTEKRRQLRNLEERRVALRCADFT